MSDYNIFIPLNHHGREQRWQARRKVPDRGNRAAYIRARPQPWPSVVINDLHYVTAPWRHCTMTSLLSLPRDESLFKVINMNSSMVNIARAVTPAPGDLISYPSVGHVRPSKLDLANISVGFVYMMPVFIICLHDMVRALYILHNLSLCNNFYTASCNIWCLAKPSKLNLANLT